MIDPHLDPSFSIDQIAILQAAKQFVLEQFNERHDPRLVFHNYHHTANIAQQVKDIGIAENVLIDVLEVAQLAAWFLNIGYTKSYQNPLDESKALARHFLETNNYSPALLDKVLACLDCIQTKTNPSTQEQQLLSDALHAQELTIQFSEQGPLLRLEEELVQQRQFSSLEWAQLQLQWLMKTKFYLPYSKQQFEPIIAKNILAQKQLVEKQSNPRYISQIEEGKPRKFQAIERKMPTSATQTFFRTNYRNHINLSAIADNKANIMISVNAIMISVLISILSYGNIMETRPMILMPVVIFMISGLTSLIFAVLSARPKVTSLNNADTKVEQAKRNIVFFGNFVQLELEQYEEAMDAMFRDSELIYGNMTRDLYHLGKVLDVKYRYLSISYTIFMIGFAATVITFLLAILT